MWIKVVGDEIVQISDVDPATLWHPDFLQFWQETFEDVNVGWKLKDGKWISGSQWLEEFQLEHPLPPPGPPTAEISIKENMFDNSVEVTFTSISSGILNEENALEWTIDGVSEGNEEEIVKGFKRLNVIQNVQVSLTVTGPGGTNTKEITYKIPAGVTPS